MIKIIKEGQTKFIGNCDTCGCQFSYELSDITLNSVYCPYCGSYYVHKRLQLIPNNVEFQKIQNEELRNYCTVTHSGDTPVNVTAKL